MRRIGWWQGIRWRLMSSLRFSCCSPVALTPTEGGCLYVFSFETCARAVAYLPGVREKLHLRLAGGAAAPRLSLRATCFRRQRPRFDATGVQKSDAESGRLGTLRGDTQPREQQLHRLKPCSAGQH